MKKNKKSSKDILNEKLDKILKNEDLILKNQKKILKEESKLEDLEEKELKEEELTLNSEKDAIEELKKLEEKLKKSKSNPLLSITKIDIVKGFIGSFLGVISHFAFSYASKIAAEISLFNATLLYIVAFIIIIIMLYYSGFRKVKKHLIFKFMPLRAVVLYLVSIITILFVNLLFGKIHFPINFIEIYKLVGASIILAVMGAGTADLIGKNE
jgi:uncharacterized membrane protein